MDQPTDHNPDGLGSIDIDRSVHLDRHESPTVELRVRSGHGVPVRADIAKRFPSDFDVNAIEPVAPASIWSIVENSLRFEVELLPGGEETLRYRVDSSEDLDAIGEPPMVRDVEQIERDPVVDRIERSSETADLISGVGTEATGNGSLGETADPSEGDDQVRGIGGRDTTEANANSADARNAEIENTPDREKPRTRVRDTTNSPNTVVGEGNEMDDVASVSTRDLIDELRTRIVNGDVSHDVQRDLISSFDVTPDTETIEPRLDHLQQRLSDLEAFTAPLEEIYEQRGSPDEVVFDIVERLESVEETVEGDTQRIETVENDVDTVVDQVDDLLDRTTELDGTVDELEANIEDVDEAIETIRDDIPGLDSVRSELSDVQSDLSAVRSDIERLSTWRRNVNSFFEQFDPEPETS
ncbi:MAG: hypothetical protein ACLFNI_09165 [Natronomonas sp.]